MLKWYEKLIVGAFGGLCLGLLKLISANFYIGVADASARIGAYLTYASYLVLGMGVGFLLSEERPERQKTMQSVFLMGLLAPSILLAVVSRPVSASDIGPNKGLGIPQLGTVLDVIFTPVFAQASSPIIHLNKRDVELGFGAGVKSALGIQTLPRQTAAFVVGKTEDEKVAENAAIRINSLLSKSDARYMAKILKPEGSVNYYVTVGGVVTGTKALSIQSAVKGAAIDGLVGSPSGDITIAAKMIRKGNVFTGAELFEK